MASMEKMNNYIDLKLSEMYKETYDVYLCCILHMNGPNVTDISPCHFTACLPNPSVPFIASSYVCMQCSPPVGETD